ncbi:MAG: Ku protein [Allorhizobium sp.]
MAGHRAQWKGFIKIGEVSCGVGLYTAASTSDRLAFNTINTATGNRVSRVFIDSETEAPVEKEQQTKGFEVDSGQYIRIDPEEIAAAIPQSNKTLEIEAFISCREVDEVYFDKPYYLVPDKMGADGFVALREAMRRSKVAAIARTVLFRRMRTVLIRPHGKGLIATTLNFDYEVRSSAMAFENMPKMKIEGEMLDLAKHIIGTKKGHFDPATFDDRYEAALAELVKAKMDGKALPKRRSVDLSAPDDLLAALRESAGIISSVHQKPKRTAAKAGAGRARAAPATATAGKTTAPKATLQRKAG